MERLEAEIAEVEASEAPPAVLNRLQAQHRVESEEIRLLEEQLAEMDGRRSAGGAPGPGMRLGSLPQLAVRIGLALLATAVLFFAVRAVLSLLPHVPETVSSIGAPATSTLSPTYTPGASTPTTALDLAAAAVAAEGITSTSAISVEPPALAEASSTATPTATPTPEPSPTPVVLTARVRADPLNFRGGPGTQYPVKGQLYVGESLQVTGRTADSGWLSVRTASGETGWVKTEFLTVTVALDTIPVATATGSGG